MLQKVFGWSEFYAKWGMPGMKSWAYHAWAVDNESSVWGAGKVRSGKGYLAEEIEAIKASKKAKKKNGQRAQC